MTCGTCEGTGCCPSCAGSCDIPDPRSATVLLLCQDCSGGACPDCETPREEAMSEEGTVRAPAVEVAARQLEVRATDLGDALRAALTEEGRKLSPQVLKSLDDRLSLYFNERREFRRVFP